MHQATGDTRLTCNENNRLAWTILDRAPGSHLGPAPARQLNGSHTCPLGIQRGGTRIAAHRHAEPRHRRLSVVADYVGDCPLVVSLGALVEASMAFLINQRRKL